MPNRDLKAKTCACGLPGELQAREKARQARQRRKEERLRKHSPEFIKIESKLKSATKSVREILDVSECVDFPDDCRELLVDSLGRVRARLDEIEAVVVRRS